MCFVAKETRQYKNVTIGQILKGNKLYWLEVIRRVPAATPEQKSMDLEVNGNRESACPASLNATRTKCLARTQTPWELSSQSMMKRWLHSRIFLFRNKRVAYIFKHYVYLIVSINLIPFTFFLNNSRSLDNAIISMISILSFNFTLYPNLIQQTINKLRNHRHSIHCIML